ncbi:MAG: GNAT family N-acetyltransferase [Hydrococcus sp. RU_2_2]|nr:GNAT family N-acetyltransferase [Hydrococcus sp. RU_2_2]NJP18626.1 GNAT family N-acetyltransferase [Hydrococcus sp. CRU_1_1]
MFLNFRLMEEVDARAILEWNYEPPYDIYNASLSSIEEDVRTMLEPQNCYYAIADEDNDLVTFYRFGQDARVPGGDYSAPALDLGSGLRPDLTGQGLGLILVNAGLEFARVTFAPSAFRVTVAAFNKRALRVYHKAGFLDTQSFNRADGREFTILMREALAMSMYLTSNL